MTARPRRRRGFALISTLVALLVVAAVMDRLAASFARDRAEAEAAAAFMFIRSVSEAALFIGGDPVAAGALPHVPARRDLEFRYTAVPGGVDRLLFAWPDMSATSRTVLGNRIGEWLGRDRAATPLALGLDEIPLPYPERVRRTAPSMQVALETAGIRAVGTVAAADGQWSSADTDTLAVNPPVPGDDAGVIAATVTVGGTVTAARLEAGAAMGVPVPVTLTVTTPPAGQDALRLESLATDALDVSTRLASTRGTVTAPAPADADALVLPAGVVPDLRAATINNVTAGSVRTRSTTVTSLVVTSTCVGCTP